MRKLIINAYGVNHKTAGASLRGKLAFSREKARELAAALKKRSCLETFVLSTCNRSEAYTVWKGEAKPSDIVGREMSALFGLDVSGFCYSYDGESAARHAFSVAAGLDSALLFEDQILGQMKEAHMAAMENALSGKYLNRLIRDAVTCAKAIKTERPGNDGVRSLARAGMDFLREKHGGFTGRRVMFIGLGKTGKLALEYALMFPFERIYAVNRSARRFYGELFADNRISYIGFEDRYSVIAGCDVDFIISATSSPHTVIEAGKLKTRGVAIADLAVPSDVDVRVRDMAGVRLYTIDDLGDTAQDFHKGKRGQILFAQEKIEEYLAKYMSWLSAESERESAKVLGAGCLPGGGRISFAK